MRSPLILLKDKVNEADDGNMTWFRDPPVVVTSRHYALSLLCSIILPDFFGS